MADQRVPRRFVTPAVGLAEARSRVVAGRQRSPRPSVQEAQGEVIPMDGWGDTEGIAIDLLKSSTAPYQVFRKGDHVHVSDVISKCLRKIALMRRLGVRHPAERIPDGQGITFAIGDAVHDYVKARFVKAHPDMVWALWECACTHTTIGPCTFSNRGRQTTCPKCGTEVARHKEASFYDEELDLVGNPDLLLQIPQHQALYPVEIKSMASGQWDELVRPLPDHIIQISFYWHLLRASKKRVMGGSSILYAKKDYSFKFPYKEKAVSQPDTQARLRPYIDDLRILKAAKTGGPLPVRVTCATLDAPEAKKCSVCVQCFEEGRKK